MAKLNKSTTTFLAQVLKIISEYDFQITLRQLYYQLVARQIIPNKQKFYTKLSRDCVKGRDAGLLPEDAIIDRLRLIQKPSSWIDLKDFLNTVKQAYRKDIWSDQENYVEIWTEKDALREVIGSITNKWNVILLVVRGQVSRTAIYEAGERFKANRNKNCYLYYYGDHDPSGYAIYNSLVERLKHFVLAPITIKRIALSKEQIQIYNLPRDPAKQSDPNYKKFVKQYGDNVVELDSLPPNILKKLVEDYITELIDGKKLAQVQLIEKSEKKQIQEWIGNYVS